MMKEVEMCGLIVVGVLICILAGLIGWHAVIVGALVLFILGMLEVI